jgi:hypothetical protein
MSDARAPPVCYASEPWDWAGKQPSNFAKKRKWARPTQAGTHGGLFGL